MVGAGDGLKIACGNQKPNTWRIQVLEMIGVVEASGNGGVQTQGTGEEVGDCEGALPG